VVVFIDRLDIEEEERVEHFVAVVPKRRKDKKKDFDFIILSIFFL
jgi:hypothetical protein